MLPFVLASLLVDGVVVDQESAWEGGLIITRSTVETADGTIVVRHAGGAIDGIAQVASDTPWIGLGERVRIEVAPDGPDGGELTLAAKVPLVQYYVRTTTLSSNPPCSGTEVHPLYWPVVNVPFALDAAGSLDVPFEEVQAAIQASFDTWEDVECSYLAFADQGAVEGVPVGYDRDGENQNLVTWVERDWLHAPSAIAVTVLTFACADGQIFDADILMNGGNFDFTVRPDTAVDAHDIQNTVTHEVGHLIGFDHTTDQTSTMYADATAGESIKRDLSADDVEGICVVYPTGSEPEVTGGCGDPRTGAAFGPLAAVFLITSGRWRGRSSRRARRSL